MKNQKSKFLYVIIMHFRTGNIDLKLGAFLMSIFIVFCFIRCDKCDDEMLFIGEGNHGEDDAWIMKLDAAGNIQWQKCFGGIYVEGARSIRQTSEGEYIFAGRTTGIYHDITHSSNDLWVVKLDAFGNIKWQQSYGERGEERASSIEQTLDGGFIVVGFTTYLEEGQPLDMPGDENCWILKLDKSGNVQWQKSLGGTDYERSSSIQQTTDGGYILAGTTYSNDGDVSGNHGEGDCWIAKLGISGNIQWQKSYGGSTWDDAHSIQQTADGGYIIAGTTSSFDGDVAVNQ